MKKIIFICVGLLLVNCISNEKGRSPGSLNDHDFSKVDIDKLEKIYRFALDHQSGNKFKILNYPTSSAEDVTNGTEAIQQFEKLEAIQKTKDDFRNALWSQLPHTLNQEELTTLAGDYVRPQILSRLNEAEKKTLIKFCFGPKGAGDYLEIGSFATFECNNYNFLITEEDIARSLESIPNKPSGVYYDGGNGWHIYEDKDLEYNIQVLTLAIALEKERFVSIFDSLDKSIREKFRHNSHGMSEEDKIEPFDLLSSYSTWHIIGQSSGQSDFGDLNKIYIGKLVQKSMSRLFQMFDRDPESDKLPTMSIMKKEGRALFWCANGRFKPRHHTSTEKPNYSFFRSYGNDILEGMVPSFKLAELIEKKQMGFTFFCNTMEYKTSVRVEKAEAINPPQPIDYSNQEQINVLITVALVSEMNSSALTLGKTYLRTMGGWSLVEDFKEIDTKSEFTRLLPDTDMYIPVSHAMDVNAFHVGTVKGYSLKLRKSVTDKSGRTKVLNATLLLPKSDNGIGSSLIMNPDSLSDLLLQRSKQNKQPLFLMNTSCGSEKTLFTWMTTYRNVLRKKMKLGLISNVLEDHGAPHIIGSKRYFDTGSTGAILSHLSYPSGAIEQLAKGNSVAEVVEFLKQGQKKSFVGGIMSFFGDNDSQSDQSNSPENFEPDYVMDHPELLEIGGYRINVNRRGFPAEREY